MNHLPESIASCCVCVRQAPVWLPLTGIDGKGNMGEVLVSFWLLQKRELDQPITAPKVGQ